MPLEIKVPWPATALSPNVRGHWTRGYKARQMYRCLCRIEADSQVAWDKSLPEKLHLHLVFHKPTKRHYDLDNLIARMKSGIDGVCDSLQINDKRFQSNSAEFVDVTDESRRVGGHVLIIIKGTP
ncbi:MAG: hypothetical protein EBY29_16155 [Planctomycetes bacterium]|nr:hypothetical protein [Planctomycetota bacterium]